MIGTKRYFIVFALFLIVGIISLNLYFQQIRPAKKIDVSSFPYEIDGWKAEDIPIDERSYEILETRDVILREYTKDNQRIILYIVVSLDNRKVSHPPEVCYIGSGIDLVSKRKEAIPYKAGAELLANKMIMQKGQNKEVVLYWYKAGDNFLSSYYSQQLKIALNQLRFKTTSGALIRISSPIIGGEKESVEQLKSFAVNIIPLVLKYIP